MKQVFCFLFLLILFSSCASYRYKTSEGYNLFNEGKYQEASDTYKKGAEEDSVDQLLYLMDRGTAFHAAEDYVNSNKDLLKADKMAEIKDYTSLSAEAGSLLTNDRIIQYKGEDFENILINVFLAINYLMLEKYEDALVECRRVNRKLYLMKTEGKRDYKQNAFARYLSAVIYENTGDYNNAYVDYKKTYELIDNWRELGLDLYRLARKQKFYDDMEKWKKIFEITDEEIKKEHEKLRLKYAQVFLIIQNGKAPIKRPDPSWQALPKFYKRHSEYEYVLVSVKSTDLADLIQSKDFEKESFILDDVEYNAIKNLDEKYGAMIAKKIAGIVAKEAVGAAVEEVTDSPILGLLTKVALHVSNQADLRSWATLPKDFQIIRLWLEPGEYNIKISPIDHFDKIDLENSIVLNKLFLKKKEIKYLNYRILDY